MRDRDFGRRDFLKIAGAGLVSVWLSQRVRIRADAEKSGNIEGQGILEGQYFIPTGLSMLLVPIRKDWTLDNTGSKARVPVSLSLNGGVMLQARNIKNIEINGVGLKVAEVPFMGGDFPYNPKVSQNADQYLALGVLEAGGKAFYEQKLYTNDEILSGFTAVLEQSLYPAEVHNILESAKNLLTFQEENAGFSDGDYSFLQIQKRLKGDPGFKPGRNAVGGLEVAGGVDACASLLSKSLYRLTQTGNATYLERNLSIDGNVYFAGPSAPEITELATDATASVSPDSKHRTDFTWKFQDLGKVYLTIGARLIPNAGNWKGESSWLDMPADAKLVMTLNWSKNPPSGSQVAGIQNLIDLYDNYHKDGPNSEAGLTLSTYGKETPFPWSEAEAISEAVHPELPLDNFSAEINGSDKGSALNNIIDSLLKLKKSNRPISDFPPSEVTKFYTAFIFYCRGAVDDYNVLHPFSPEDFKAKKPHPIRLGEFLKTKMKEDGIFQALKDALFPNSQGGITDFEKAFWPLDYNTYVVPGESVQCLGWVGFLGKLGFPISPAAKIGDIDTGSASGLLPDDGRKALKSGDTWIRDWELLFKRVNKTEDVEVGDSFDRYGNGKNHIGAVISKKVVDGETMLLITDANRKSDGVIRIFKVTKDNFRVIFGEGEATPPVVIRNINVKNYLGSFNEVSFLHR